MNVNIFEIDNNIIRYIIIYIMLPFYMINNIIVYSIVSIMNTWHLTIVPLLNKQKPMHQNVVNNIVLYTKTPEK